MAREIIRPDTAFASTNWTATAPHDYTVVADEDDLTWLVLDILPVGTTGSISFTFENPSLPGDATVTRLNLKLRVGADQGFPGWLSSVELKGADDQLASGSVVINWTSPTTVTALQFAEDTIGEVDLDALTLTLTGTMSTGRPVVYEAWVEIVYSAPPSVTVTGPSGTITNDDTPTITWEMS